jgi:gamma-glutamylcyclotransferase (GGCT)/AIG2-like uncharacterized protein YtfP
MLKNRKTRIFFIAMPGIQKNQMVAVYGTLMKNYKGQNLADIKGALRFISPCTLSGNLYDMGEYPGLIDGRGKVAGELYEVRTDAILKKLDEYEEFDPTNPDGSLFVRRRVRLKKPPVECWVYFYNHDVTGKTKIPEGNWAKYIRKLVFAANFHSKNGPHSMSQVRRVCHRRNQTATEGGAD